MNLDQAKELLERLTRATINVMKQFNSNRGVTKKAAKEEFDAANAIYVELTGVKLTLEEWNKISG